jgi:hypothetical protein
VNLLHLKIVWPDFEIEGKVDLTIQQIAFARGMEQLPNI